LFSQNFAYQKGLEDDSWAPMNELSISTTAESTGSLSDLSFTDSDGESEYDQQPELMHVDVHDENLFFYAPCDQEKDSGSRGELLRVEALRTSANGAISVVGHEQVSPEDLFVDCRVSLSDDPKLVKLLDTRLCDGGRTRSLLLEQATTATAASAYCEVNTSRCGEKSIHRVPLAAAVAAVRQARWERDQAAMLIHQRSVNTKIMGQRRRVALGLN